MISSNPKHGEWPLIKVIAPSSTPGDFPESAKDSDAVIDIGRLFRDPYTGEVWMLDHFVCIPRLGDHITFGRDDIDHIDGAIVDKVMLFGMGWEDDNGANESDDMHGMVVSAYVDVVLVPGTTKRLRGAN